MLQDIAKTIFKTQISYRSANNLVNYYSSINSAEIINKSNQIIGNVGILDDKINDLIDKRYTVAIAEINFSKLAHSVTDQKPKIKLSKYQTVKIDFNFLVDNKMLYVDFEKIVNNYKPKLECSFSFINIYESKELLGKKSITIRAEIGSSERTLTSEDIERFRNKFLLHMQQNGINIKE